MKNLSYQTENNKGLAQQVFVFLNCLLGISLLFMGLLHFKFATESFVHEEMPKSKKEEPRLKIKNLEKVEKAVLKSSLKSLRSNLKASQNS